VTVTSFCFLSFTFYFKGNIMTKKIYLPLLISVLLTGCGGGGGTPSAQPATATNDTTIENAETETRTSSEIIQEIGVNPVPYDDALAIDDVTKKAYLDAINDARQTQQVCNGKPTGPVSPLVWSDTLYKAAYEHTNDLVESDTFDHNGSNTHSDWTAVAQELGRGSQPHERMANNGYQFHMVGENITAGFEDKDPGKPKNTAQMAVASWLASTSGHCENLMNPDYIEVGMAYIEKEGTKYVHYWTQNLGKPQ